MISMWMMRKMICRTVNSGWLRLVAGVFMAVLLPSVFAQGKVEVPDSLFEKAVEFVKL